METSPAPGSLWFLSPAGKELVRPQTHETPPSNTLPPACVPITDSSVAETQIRIKMMQHAKRSVFLTASSKIGREFFYVMANVNDIDTIISEKPLPKEWQKQNAGENASR